MIIYYTQNTWTLVGRDQWAIQLEVRGDKLDVWQGKLSESTLGREMDKYDLGSWEALYGPDIAKTMEEHVKSWMRTKCNWKPETIFSYWEDVYDVELLRVYAKHCLKYASKPEIKAWLCEDKDSQFDFVWLSENLLYILDKTGGIE